MSTKLETARCAADYARTEEAREKQTGRNLIMKEGAAEAVRRAAEIEIWDAGQ